MRNHLPIAALSFLIASSAVARANDKPPEDLLQKIAALKEDVVTVKHDLDTAFAEGAALRKQEKQLSGSIDHLKESFREWSDDKQKHDAEVRDETGQVARHNSNRCTYEEGHPEQCSAYQAEASRLNDWGKRLDSEEETLQRRQSDLVATREKLHREASEWDSKTKSNKAKIEEMLVKQKAAIAKANDFTIDDEFLRDLKLRALISKYCANTSDLEAASQCLQRVWDGASH